MDKMKNDLSGLKDMLISFITKVVNSIRSESV